MSSDNHYEIIFSGKVRTNFDPQRAYDLLIKKAGVSNSRLRLLIDSSPYRIKAFASLGEAKSYIKAIWQLGWHTSLNYDQKQIFSTEGKSRRSVNPDNLSKVREQEVESLLFPTGWKPVSGLNSNASMQASCAVENSYFISIAQKKQDFDQVPTLHQYAKATVNDACQRMASVYMEEFCRLIKIDRSQDEAYLSELFMALEKPLNPADIGTVHDLVYLIVVFEGSQAFYTLYFWCAKSDYRRLKPTFLGIIESFRLEYRQHNQVA
ncbi:hypothetical protein R50073_30250 [Maricurvus nonylphenolicus]|uniref:PsbP-related protein n=1 Tax=Maricurvus nonylphenolicus TaxID=1008307 RepID=UPI0036F24B72